MPTFTEAAAQRIDARDRQLVALTAINNEQAATITELRQQNQQLQQTIDFLKRREEWAASDTHLIG